MMRWFCWFLILLPGVFSEAPSELIQKQKGFIDALKAEMTLEEKLEIYSEINAIGDELFSLQRRDEPWMSHVVVKAGDSLTRLSYQHHVAKGWWTTINKLKRPDLIYVGQKLFYPKAKRTVHVIKSRYECRLYCGDLIYRIYAVGLGAQGRRTPVTKTSMSSSRSQFPIYTDRETGITYPYGHKLNPVGTRWMGLAMGDGYGIHGTQEEKTIGQSKSKGCVRMYQHDLEELFDLTLTGDQVLITEE